uniref:Uncharacterized protein n=1 Tax=Triticum urartu TaxID=4572 RepID=A0A8R7TH02_TRIUA
MVRSCAKDRVLGLPVMGTEMVELGAGIMEVVIVEVVAAAAAAEAAASDEGVPLLAAIPGLWRRLRCRWHHSRACRG